MGHRIDDELFNPNNQGLRARLPDEAILRGVADGGDGHHIGVYGKSVSNFGVYAESAAHVGLLATGGHLAGQFDGAVQVNGDLLVSGDVQLINADFAEDFDVAAAAPVAPGTVMVLGDDGALRPSTRAYDRRVAGIVSGAGDYRPGIVLDRRAADRPGRQAVALLGKVYCKVDAGYGAVAVGDLLTTSPRPGHAMKAADPARAFGAVLGKALRSQREGLGLIPVLVTLQ
jgi:hypothetical protein